MTLRHDHRGSGQSFIPIFQGFSSFTVTSLEIKNENWVRFRVICLTNCLILSSLILGKAVRKENGTQRPEAQLTAQKIPLCSPSDCLITIIERCIPIGNIKQRTSEMFQEKDSGSTRNYCLWLFHGNIGHYSSRILANQQTASNVTSSLSGAINQTVKQ